MKATDTDPPTTLDEITQIDPHDDADFQKMLNFFGVDLGQQEPIVIITGQRTYGRKEVFIVDESELEAQQCQCSHESMRTSLTSGN